MRPSSENRSRSQSGNSNSSDGSDDSKNDPAEPIITRSRTSKLLQVAHHNRRGFKHKTSNVNVSNGFKKVVKFSNGVKSDAKRDKEPLNGPRSSGAYSKHYRSYRKTGPTKLSQSSRLKSYTNSINSGYGKTRDSVKFNFGKNYPNKISSQSWSSHRFRSAKRDVCRRTISSRTPLTSPSTSNDSGSESGSNTCRKDKGSKRKSALWVLNCEAEEFLFGETAADKHELELPPQLYPESPPPKKRRRWRETELSHLLQTSPFLESKLRSSSSDSGRESVNPSPPPKLRKHATNSRTKLARSANAGRAVRRRVKRTNFSRRKYCKPTNHNHTHYNDYSMQLDEINRFMGVSPLLSPASSIHSNYSYSEQKALIMTETIASLPWTFSFETDPIDESWYPIFSRQEGSVIPYKFFESPYVESLQLPYEVEKPLIRSRRKVVKNSRKSPRCHASTLAMLSSEIPPWMRSPRNSLCLEPPPNTRLASPPTSPPLPSPHISSAASEASLVSFLASSSSRTLRSGEVSPFSKFVGEQPSRLRPRSSSGVKSSASTSASRQELSLQQFVWDSVCFLSDPYVVSILAGEEPSQETCEVFDPALTNPNSTNHKSMRYYSSNSAIGNQKCKKVVQNSEALERKASLRSCDGGASSSSSSKTVPASKGSPKCGSSVVKPLNGAISTSCRVALNGISKSLDGRNHVFDGISKTLKFRGKAFCNGNGAMSRSPSPPVTRSNNSSPTSDLEKEARQRLGTKRSTVVLVSDVLRNGTTCKGKAAAFEEEMLFMGESLPPLPSWPV